MNYIIQDSRSLVKVSVDPVLAGQGNLKFGSTETENLTVPLIDLKATGTMYAISSLYKFNEFTCLQRDGVSLQSQYCASKTRPALFNYRIPALFEDHCRKFC